MAEPETHRFGGPLPGFDRDQKVGDVVEFLGSTDPYMPQCRDGKWRIVELFDDDSAIYERVVEEPVNAA